MARFIMAVTGREKRNGHGIGVSFHRVACASIGNAVKRKKPLKISVVDSRVSSGRLLYLFYSFHPASKRRDDGRQEKQKRCAGSAILGTRRTTGRHWNWEPFPTTSDLFHFIRVHYFFFAFSLYWFHFFYWYLLSCAEFYLVLLGYAEIEKKNFFWIFN